MFLPTIWIVGDTQEPVFADAIFWLHSHAACECFDSSTTAIEKQNAADDRTFPLAILFVQSRPGQFSSQDIERLHAQHPLSRLVALTGPWCEGEMRSGRPSPGIVRVPWRSWQNRLPCELEFDNDAAKGLPRIASDTDRLQTASVGLKSAKPLGGTAAIFTSTMANYRYLSDAIGQLGLTTVRHTAGVSSPVPTADVTIFDGWENVVSSDEHGPRSNGQPAPRRAVVLHFPRPEDHARARQTNIGAVLAQPLSQAELAVSLSRLLGQPA